MHPKGRRALLLAIGGTAVLSSGCGTKPLRPANADGTYCFHYRRSYRWPPICTASPIPSEQVEANAKRFEPAEGKLTVYVIRWRWGDVEDVVQVGVDLAVVEVLPASFARLRLPPGSHRIAVNWPGGSAALDVTGVAGEMVFVEVISSILTWSSHYRLERGDTAESRRRAAKLRLVAAVG